MKLLTRTLLLFLTTLALVTAAYAEDSVAYAVEGGYIRFDKESGAITSCDRDVTQAVIPSQIADVSVTSIKTYAFASCWNLTSVEIPDSVTSIGYGAFSGCSHLTSVEIPNSVTSIGDSAFNECRRLTSVKISNRVTSIGKFTFHLCDNLRSAEIPNSVTSIGDSAFYGCWLTSVEIPDSVTSIGDSAFSCCYWLTNVEIPDSVTSIAKNAFLNCGSLISVKIPNSVTSIRSGMFWECKSLTSVKIPNSVTSIGKYAFATCTSLASVEIPHSVTSIGEEAFAQCYSLHDVYYAGSKEQWEKIDGIKDSYLISDNITIHYSDNAPEFAVPSAPTVGGRAISAADLSGLTEISVPVSISADTPTQVTLCVPFFDGGKFLGMGFVTATVDKTTQSVTAPVTGDVSGAGKLKVMFVDADFRPLSVAAGFDIAA